MNNENNNTFEGLELQLYYLDMAAMKEKQYEILKNSICFGRLDQFLTLGGPCNISFAEEDTLHRYPIITEYEAFKRGHINGIIFNLYHNVKNNGQFDKLIVYQAGTPKTKYLGYVFFNTKTKKSSHRYMLDNLPDAIPHSLHRDFNVMYNIDRHKYYIDKANSIKRFAKDPETPLVTAGDYKYVEEKYQKKLKIGYKYEYYF